MPHSSTNDFHDFLIDIHFLSYLCTRRLILRSLILNGLGKSVFELLNKTLESMAHELKIPFISALTEDIHVLPDFHGNRYECIKESSIGYVRLCCILCDNSIFPLMSLYV